jgi:hypothetical protein
MMIKCVTSRRKVAIVKRERKGAVREESRWIASGLIHHPVTNFSRNPSNRA